MKIKEVIIDPITFLEIDEFGDMEPIVPFTFVEQQLDYDFYTDEVIELEKSINPIDIIPQDGLRYSIINVMAFMLDKLINEAMVRYTKACNSYNDDIKCMLIMKNEFLFKSVLLTESKRSYASINELQEGTYIGEELNVKGLGVNKSTLNPMSQKRLQRILAEDILNCKEIDQMKVLKEIVLMEKDIFNSLMKGEKEYYKPVSIKSMHSYDDPMRQQGIKASVVWNTLRDPDVEAINLDRRNAVDIVKVNINPNNIEHLKETNPERYEKIMELFKQKSFAKGIETIAIPLNVETPKWVLEFINYKLIINDNIVNFKKPLESIGLQLVGGNVNYTNIISL